MIMQDKAGKALFLRAFFAWQNHKRRRKNMKKHETGSVGERRPSDGRATAERRPSDGRAKVGGSGGAGG